MFLSIKNSHNINVQCFYSYMKSSRKSNYILDNQGSIKHELESKYMLLILSLSLKHLLVWTD